MERPSITEVNCATGEVTSRYATAEELAELQSAPNTNTEE